jgi:hypothetical protein
MGESVSKLDGFATPCRKSEGKTRSVIKSDKSPNAHLEVKTELTLHRN